MKTLVEADHHGQHEVAQRHFPESLLRNLGLFAQMNSDIHGAYRHREVLPKFHFHTLS